MGLGKVTEGLGVVGKGVLWVGRATLQTTDLLVAQPNLNAKNGVSDEYMLKCLIERDDLLRRFQHQNPG